MRDFVKSKNSDIEKGEKISDPIARQTKFITLIDEETSELIGMFPLRQRTLGKGWIALYQASAEWLALLRLTGEQYRVLLFLLGRLDFDNYLHVRNKEIAEALHLQSSNVARTMKKLRELGIIVADSGKYFKAYRLNPEIVHKGTNRNKTVDEFNELLAEKDIEAESTSQV